MSVHLHRFVAAFVLSGFLFAASAQANETVLLENAATDAESGLAQIAALNKELLDRPEDDAVRFQLARLLVRAGDLPQARRHYETLLNGHPENVDYSFGRAQVLAWQGDNAAALAELERAISLAPDYEAVWELYLSVAMRVPDNENEIERVRDFAALEFPASGWWQKAVVESEHHWMLSLGAVHENLSGDRADWSGQFATVAWHRDLQTRIYAGLSSDRRFDDSDRQYTLGVSGRLAYGWTGGIEYSSVASPNFLPETVLSANAGRPFVQGWGVDFRWRQRKYESVTVSSYGALVERYFGNYRAAYTLGYSRLHGQAGTFSHVGSVNWYLAENTSAGISIAGGTEAETIAPGQVLETDFATVTISGRHRLTDRLVVDGWFGLHRQGDIYRRRYVGVAISLRL